MWEHVSKIRERLKESMQITKQSNCSLLLNKVKYNKEIQFDSTPHEHHHKEIHEGKVKSVREQVYTAQGSQYLKRIN